MDTLNGLKWEATSRKLKQLTAVCITAVGLLLGLAACTPNGNASDDETTPKTTDTLNAFGSDFTQELLPTPTLAVPVNVHENSSRQAIANVMSEVRMGAASESGASFQYFDTFHNGYDLAAKGGKINQYQLAAGAEVLVTNSAGQYLYAEGSGGIHGLIALTQSDVLAQLKNRSSESPVLDQLHAALTNGGIAYVYPSRELNPEQKSILGESDFTLDTHHILMKAEDGSSINRYYMRVMKGGFPIFLVTFDSKYEVGEYNIIDIQIEQKGPFPPIPMTDHTPHKDGLMVLNIGNPDPYSSLLDF